MLSIFHFFRLSYCCLDRLCRFVGYQHLIFSPISSTVRASRRLWPMLIALLHPTIDCYNSSLILLIDRPLPSLIPISIRPQPRLVAYSRFVSRRFSLTTDCQPSTLCYDLGSYTPTNHTNTLPRPCHTSQPTTTLVRPALRTRATLSSTLPLVSSGHHPLPHTILMPCRSWFRSLGVLRS